jgi:hypothetical protein
VAVAKEDIETERKESHHEAGVDLQNAGPSSQQQNATPPTSAQLRSAGTYEWMIEALADVARHKNRTIDGHLVTVGKALLLPGTAATARCHFVARDGNGQVLVSKLARKLTAQVVDYCVPPSRVAEARAAGSTEAVLALQQEAIDLFTKLDLSGEAGELLLYLLLETVLALPQLLCKMSLKTNPQMHVHGTDGIHGQVLADGQLALYWGEAKLHADPTKAIDSCFTSLVPFLKGGWDGPASRDLQLLRDGLDLSDPRLLEALSRYLCDDTVESTRVQFRGAALIGFNLDDYPNPHESDGATVSAQVDAAIATWFGRIGSSVTKHAVERFHLELFCVPVPSVAALRDEMRRALRIGP